MDDDSGETSQSQAVVDSKGGRHEDGRVCRIFLRIEEAVGDDSLDLILGAGVIEGTAGRDGQVCRIPCVRDCLRIELWQRADGKRNSQ